MTNPTMNPGKLWNGRFIHLLLIELVFQSGTYMVNPVVSKYVVLLGSSLAVGGFVAGLVATAALAMRPFTGWVADRLSKTTLLVLAALLFTIAAFGCAFASDVHWIALFRIVQGFAFAFRSAVVLSLVSVVVPHDYLGRSVGWVGVVTMASSAIAPSVAVAIGSRLGYSDCFMVAGGVFSIGLVLTVLFKLPKDVRRNHEHHRALRNLEKRDSERSFRLRDLIYAPAIPFTVIAALSGVPHGINVSLLLTVGDARGIAGVSLYFTLYALATLVARPVMGRLCDTKDFRLVVAPVLIVELVGVAALIAMHSLVGAALAGALIGVGQGSAYSALQAEALRSARVQELGRASNTFYVGPDINMGVSPLLGGFIMQTWGVSAMYLACFGLVAVALILFLSMKRSASFSVSEPTEEVKEACH